MNYYLPNYILLTITLLPNYERITFITYSLFIRRESHLAGKPKLEMDRQTGHHIPPRQDQRV